MNGHQPIFIDRFDLLNMGSSSQLSLGPKPDLAFFSNGWQSWSYCGVYAPGERFRRTRLGFLRLPTEANAGASRPSRSGLYPSQMFGVVGDRASRLAMLAGFLSQKEHFGTVEMGAVKELPAGTAMGQKARRINCRWARRKTCRAPTYMCGPTATAPGWTRASA